MSPLIPTRIILTSEATTDLSNIMIQIIRDRFLNLSSTFKVSTPATMVAVEGAAHCARLTVTELQYLNPGPCGDYVYFENVNMENGQVSHEEL